MDKTQKTKDWPEDLAHENGNYSCTCVVCGERFQGHKSRHVCKECATTPVVLSNEVRP